MLRLNSFIKYKKCLSIVNTGIRRFISNTYNISEDEKDLGLDYPSSRFNPEKYVHTPPKESVDKQSSQLDKNFTEDEKEFGLEFPSSRLKIQTCLLCLASITTKCQFNQEAICFPFVSHLFKYNINIFILKLYFIFK